MWGRLPTELIHHIVDLLIEDSGARSLYQLSLVNKAFLTYARRRLFQDLSINICRDPYVATRACHTRARCIKQLAPLLTTHVPASIPRRIRTLTLNGRDIGLNVRYFFPWLLVSNPGAMDEERVTVPVLGYFTEVEELRLVEVDLFPLSYWASFRRPFQTLLSSVRTLVLDEAKFYGGPASLHSLISEMPNLERLCIKSVTWPSEMGFPNNAPSLVILLLNCSVYYPRTCELLLQAWAWSRRVKETLLPQQWKPIPSSPRHLTVYFDEDNAALSWILMPVLSEMLSKLSSLEIYSSCILSDQSVDGNPEFMKRFLARMPNIVHLTFQWRATGPPFDDLFQPDLSSVAVLRTLHLQIVCERQTWLSCRAWLRSTTRSIRGLQALKHVQITMDLNVASMSSDDIDTPTFAVDKCLCREDLAVEVRVGVFARLGPEPAHTADELMEKGWRCVQNAFSLCRERPSFAASVKAGRWL